MSLELSTFKAARKHHFLAFLTKPARSPTSDTSRETEGTARTAAGSNERLSCILWSAVGHYTLGSESSGGDLQFCVWLHSSSNDTMHLCACWLEAFHECHWRDECKPDLVLAPLQHRGWPRWEFRMLPFSFSHLSTFKIDTCLCKHISDGISITQQIQIPVVFFVIVM